MISAIMNITNVNFISQKQKPTLLQPVRFSAVIQQLESPRLVSEWIVARPAENERDEPIMDTYEFNGREPESLARLQDALRPQTSPADAVQFLRREGSFRRNGWKKVGRMLSSGLPEEVKVYVRSLRLLEDAVVYVERADDLQKHLELLGCVAILAGAIRSGRYGEARAQIDRGRRLLDSFAWANALPAAPGDEGKDLFSMLGIKAPANTVVRPPKIQLPKPRMGARQELFADANSVIDTAFGRGLDKLTVAYRRWNTEEPGLLIEAQSVQAVLYLCLLANFSKDWRECKRPDCRKFFPMGYRKNKVYCSNYCAHLEDMRRRRNEEQMKARRKRRSQSRS